jgi:hypothetical protein
MALTGLVLGGSPLLKTSRASRLFRGVSVFGYDPAERQKFIDPPVCNPFETCCCGAKARPTAF